MADQFIRIAELLNNNIVRINNDKLGKIIHDYNFVHAIDMLEYNQYQKTFQNFKESNSAIICHYYHEYANNNNHFFVISFKQTLIIFDQSSISNIESLFLTNPCLIIYSISDISPDFIHNTKINNKMINADDIFLEEISNFNQNLMIKIKTIKLMKPFFSIWQVIKSCISGFLIKQSYEKSKSNRLDFYINNHENNEFQDEEVNKNEYIFLRTIYSSSFSTVQLIYHIEKQQLFVKKEFSIYSEIFNREISNYSKINHPFLPKFFGAIKNSNYFIIEFINGETLSKIEEIQLDETDKFTIIFELIIIFQYLHKNRFVYRDLKPNNVIIDQNKDAVLIDFDRMIESKASTKDFSSPFVAPEVNYGQISYKNDIYSIGIMIGHIMRFDKKETDKSSEIYHLYEKCTNVNVEKRPSINELSKEFFNAYFSKAKKSFLDKNPKLYNEIGEIYYKGKHVTSDMNKAFYYYSLAAEKNKPEAQFKLGSMYESGKWVPRNINKAMHYYSLAANMNQVNAQLSLGYIYESGIYVNRDINKAIYYYSLASDQNDSYAQLYIGCIYESGEYVDRDINKAIHYYSLAADHNNADTQCCLGYIYESGKYVDRDINKAIHYYSLAADNNNAYAQYCLGCIYESGEYVDRDINKAIHYYSLAADHNIVDAQFCLGCIYESGEYVARNINKAIHYYSLAADQSDANAQYNLGILYNLGKYIPININKAIHYYSLAADQNDADAQCCLGYIYKSGKYIARDINKAIHYYQLAAGQNYPYVQCCLGCIYESGEYVGRDINKAIHYYSLAADQNDANAQCNLGILYNSGKYIPININKAIHYYSLAAGQNNSKAQYGLGCIYESGKHIARDINKAIHYFSLASNKNNANAQYVLGKYYLKGKYVKQNIKKGIYLLTLSSINRKIKAHFALGFVYHEGRYVKRDIQQSIHYYKEASSFNNQYAKNNLGIIFKHGYGEIQQRIGLAVEYFKEAIRQKNDKVCMYNLAHLYFYEESFENYIDESINLLISSLEKGFEPSKYLLMLVLIKKYGYNYKDIKNELCKHQISFQLTTDIGNIIIEMTYYDTFQQEYQEFKLIDYLYVCSECSMETNTILNQNKNKNQSINKNLKDLTSEFYEGFGIIL